MNVSFTIRRTALRAALVLALSFLIPSIPASAMTIAEAYALKGSGKVAAELKLAAAGAPRGNLTVSALAHPGQAEKLLADLTALGLAHGASAGRLVTGRLPYSAVNGLDRIASLHSIRPSHALFHAADPGAGRQGAIVSQGDKEMHAADARTRFGVDGTGVKVGVLSNSFNCSMGSVGSDPLSGISAVIQAGELPPGVPVLEDAPCSISIHPLAVEGRAMLEVIHDLAPGAALAFHTADNGAADMANGIRALADAGATVIVDDTTYLDEPVWQDGGPIADAVREVITRGVTYVAAAGNFGRRTYEAPFRASGKIQTIKGRTVELHDFDPASGVDTCQNITAYDADVIALALHWDQPYASIGGGPGASTDLDLFLMDENCQQVYQIPPESWTQPPHYDIGVAATNNLGGDPVETLIVATPFIPPNYPLRTYGVAIGKVAGLAPGRLRLSYLVDAGQSPGLGWRRDQPQWNTWQPFEYTSDGPTLFGHVNLPEAITAGAVSARDQRRPPPNHGLMVDTGGHQTEPFSALGGTAILFDTHGQPLAQPIQRNKPDLASDDGIDSFNRIDWRATGIPFFGTSAAAAHVAGLVALAKQAAPWAAPAQIADALRATAMDMDDTLTPAVDTGFDFATGYGLADGENLIAKLLAQPLAPRASLAETCAAPTVTLKPNARYRGTRRADIVQGAQGNEIIRGLQGNDALCGGAGNDRLEGGPGNDILEGGPGNDVLVGGPGADVFRFSGTSGTGADRIMDLGRGDIIEIVGLKDANGDGRADTGDLTVRNAPGGATVTALRPASGQARTERIAVRGRQAVQVIRALRFVN